MQLTIDTQKDSHQEIRKAIRLLMSLVDGKEVYTNEPPKNEFDIPQIGTPESEAADSGSVFGGLFDNVNSETETSEKEEPKDNQELEFYD